MRRAGGRFRRRFRSLDQLEELLEALSVDLGTGSGASGSTGLNLGMAGSLGNVDSRFLLKDFQERRRSILEGVQERMVRLKEL